MLFFTIFVIFIAFFENLYAKFRIFKAYENNCLNLFDFTFIVKDMFVCTDSGNDLTMKNL